MVERRVAIQIAALHAHTPIRHGFSVSEPVTPRSSPGATMLEVISRELASMNPAHERAIRRAERRFNAVAIVHAKRLTIPAGIIGQKHAERISFLCGSLKCGRGVDVDARDSRVYPLNEPSEDVSSSVLPYSSRIGVLNHVLNALNPAYSTAYL